MNYRSFSSFSEASRFARQHAQEIGATIKLEKKGNNWVVLSNQSCAPSINEHNTPSGSPSRYQQRSEQQRLEQQQRHDFERQKEKAVQDQMRRDSAQRMVELESHWREMRKSYLDERERYYRSLSKTELENEWDAREEMDLESDEKSRLREIVRKSKGIEPAHGASTKVCGQCLMVGDSCTCGRSWF